MNILLFDDRPQMRMFLHEILSEQGFIIYPCKSVYEADVVWKRNQDNIDTVLLDVMMTPLGLSDSLRLKTAGGQLTGWIWLWYHLNPNNDSPHPLHDKNIIIFSGYLEDFRAYLDSLPDDSPEKRMGTSLCCISKGDADCEQKIVNALSEFLVN